MAIISLDDLDKLYVASSVCRFATPTPTAFGDWVNLTPLLNLSTLLITGEPNRVLYINSDGDVATSSTYTHNKDAGTANLLLSGSGTTFSRYYSLSDFSWSIEDDDGNIRSINAARTTTIDGTVTNYFIELEVIGITSTTTGTNTFGVYPDKTESSKRVYAPSFDFDTTTSGGEGIIYQNASRLIHSYSGTAPASSEDYPIFIGRNAGNLTNTTSIRSVGIGAGALNAITTGNSNTAVGAFAMNLATEATSNVAVGNYALESLETGSYNVALGPTALQFLENGSGNVCIGKDTYRDAASGDYNVCIGYHALNTGSGSNNVVIGYKAGESLTGSKNVLIGYEAGKTLTGSDKLKIANNSTTALIDGDFVAQTITINGSLKSTGVLNIPSVGTPTGTADAAGVNGDVRYDASYIYIKVSGTGWLRAALNSW